ncbi:TIGR00341 family protein [Nitrosomonas cryotolerans]|uniref:TIGR00341 family protein n=1 Tax=Nitrosomonas cryotolerans ATCC 49181 TaxID=1131553 RepID=A0A1N6IPP6_9PROT|nr:TIGR00341 family protein [Nitrosomonas cryotolerans]SFP35137.1 TIGR00341 family protein [Nitrosomonas cryotolerans]SIO33999.1 TIGR00341 family protein [Nitrosomonas cryotolerans ATCC 49181]
MKYIEVVANTGSSATVLAIAEKVKAQDFRLGIVGEDGMQQMRLIVADDKLQITLDALQNVLGAQPTARILILPIETSLPKLAEEERSQEDSATAAREALYEEIAKSARFDFNFVVLIILSTIVATIGLIENNIAVVIGAMVIAPLLGPNLALSLGIALADISLAWKSARTLFAGILLVIALSAGFGIIWPSNITNYLLMSQTEAGFESIALALASGAAAALSLTTGLSSVLVGVMVAVALLPPAATLGFMLGHNNPDLFISAGLLLIINVVCINLATIIVFFIKKIRPRTWLEKKKARYVMLIYILGWLVTLTILIFIIYTRHSLVT